MTFLFSFKEQEEEKNHKRKKNFTMSVAEFVAHINLLQNAVSNHLILVRRLKAYIQHAVDNSVLIQNAIELEMYLAQLNELLSSELLLSNPSIALQKTNSIKQHIHIVAIQVSAKQSPLDLYLFKQVTQNANLAEHYCALLETTINKIQPFLQTVSMTNHKVATSKQPEPVAMSPPSKQKEPKNDSKLREILSLKEQELQRITAEKEKLRHEIAAEQKKEGQWKENQLELQKQLEQLKQELSAKTQEIEKMKTQFASLETTQAKNAQDEQKKIAEQNQLLEAAKKQVQEKEQALKQTEDEVKKFQNEIAKLQRVQKTMQQAKSAQSAALPQQVQEQKAKIEQLTRDITTKQESIAQIEQELQSSKANLEQKTSQMQRDIDAKDTQITSLKRRIEIEEQNVRLLNQDKTTKEQVIARLQEQSQKTKNQIEQLNQQLEAEKLNASQIEQRSITRIQNAEADLQKKMQVAKTRIVDGVAESVLAKTRCLQNKTQNNFSDCFQDKPTQLPNHVMFETNNTTASNLLTELKRLEGEFNNLDKILGWETVVQNLKRQQTLQNQLQNLMIENEKMATYVKRIPQTREKCDRNKFQTSVDHLLADQQLFLDKCNQCNDEQCSNEIASDYKNATLNYVASSEEDFKNYMTAIYNPIVVKLEDIENELSDNSQQQSKAADLNTLGGLQSQRHVLQQKQKELVQNLSQVAHMWDAEQRQKNFAILDQRLQSKIADVCEMKLRDSNYVFDTSFLEKCRNLGFSYCEKAEDVAKCLAEQKDYTAMLEKYGVQGALTPNFNQMLKESQAKLEGMDSKIMELENQIRLSQSVENYNTLMDNLTQIIAARKQEEIQLQFQILEQHVNDLRQPNVSQTAEPQRCEHLQDQDAKSCENCTAVGTCAYYDAISAGYKKSQRAWKQLQERFTELSKEIKSSKTDLNKYRTLVTEYIEMYKDISQLEQQKNTPVFDASEFKTAVESIIRTQIKDMTQINDMTQTQKIAVDLNVRSEILKNMTTMNMIITEINLALTNLSQPVTQNQLQNLSRLMSQFAEANVGWQTIKTQVASIGQTGQAGVVLKKTEQAKVTEVSQIASATEQGGVTQVQLHIPTPTEQAKEGGEVKIHSAAPCPQLTAGDLTEINTKLLRLCQLVSQKSVNFNLQQLTDEWQQHPELVTKNKHTINILLNGLETYFNTWKPQIEHDLKMTLETYKSHDVRPFDVVLYLYDTEMPRTTQFVKGFDYFLKAYPKLLSAIKSNFVKQDSKILEPFEKLITTNDFSMFPVYTWSLNPDTLILKKLDELYENAKTQFLAFFNQGTDAEPAFNSIHDQYSLYAALLPNDKIPTFGPENLKQIMTHEERTGTRTRGMGTNFGNLKDLILRTGASKRTQIPNNNEYISYFS